MSILRAIIDFLRRLFGGPSRPVVVEPEGIGGATEGPVQPRPDTPPVARADPFTEPRFFFDYDRIPMVDWWERWPNFTPSEIGRKRQDASDKTILVNPHALDCLQALRRDWGEAMHINSGYRSPDYNERIGGAKASKHLEGIAFDVAMPKARQAAFIAAARRHGFRGIGRYPNFVHIDTRPEAAEWEG